MADVLNDARDGALSPSWRADLRSYALTLPIMTSLATGRVDGDTTPNERFISLPSHVARECFFDDSRIGPIVSSVRSEKQRVGLLFACALLDITRIHPAAWEPFATQGDWRRALHQWYTDQIAVLYSTKNIPGAAAHRADGEDAVIAAQERDVTEAKYRAGLCAGAGEARDWRWWFVEQIDTWQPTPLRDHYRRRMKTGDNFAAWEMLPHSWISHRA